MTTITTFEPSTSSSSASSNHQRSSTDILSTPDFAYLNWAIKNLDFMTTPSQPQPQSQSQSQLASPPKSDIDYLATATNLELNENERVDALQKLNTFIIDEIRSRNLQASTINRERGNTISLSLFDLTSDPSQEIRMEAFVVLIHLAILIKKLQDNRLMTRLNERETYPNSNRTSMPLSGIDYALVFEMAVDTFDDHKESDLESFYQVFREYNSSGRQLYLSL